MRKITNMEGDRKVGDECLMDASISCPYLMNVDDPSEECQHKQTQAPKDIQAQMDMKS
jgi:hypothetical protein